MTIRENIEHVKERIAVAAARASRSADEITIVAVAKTVPPEKIDEARTHGITIIGENRVQEAKQKFLILGNSVVWHLVGHLQTNKVKDALSIFSLIHSLDSLKLAMELEKRAEHAVDCLIEVNTSHEASKFGVAPEAVFDFFESLQEFSKIRLVGLMTIGPGWALQDPEVSRPCFGKLRDLRDTLVQTYDHPLPILSMGMTSDFEVAIEEGATMIRIGTAIFGPRTIHEP